MTAGTRKLVCRTSFAASTKGSKSMKTLALRAAQLILTWTLLHLFACHEDINSALKKQEGELATEPRTTVLARYREKFEATPTSADAMFLYARLVEDNDERHKLSVRLTTDFPKFAWGWFLKSHDSSERLDHRAQLEEISVAASLDPNAMLMGETARTDKANILVFAPAFDGRRAFEKIDLQSRTQSTAFLKKLNSAKYGDDDRLFDEQKAYVKAHPYCAALFESIPGQPLLSNGLEVKGFWLDPTLPDSVQYLGSNYFFIGVAIRNNTSSTILVPKVRSLDVACWREGGPVAYGSEEGYASQLKGQGLLFDSVSIPPGESRCPHALVERDKYSRCRVAGIPRQEQLVSLYAPTR